MMFQTDAVFVEAGVYIEDFRYFAIVGVVNKNGNAEGIRHSQISGVVNKK